MSEIDWEKNHGKIIHEGVFEDLYQEVCELKKKVRKQEGEDI